MSTELVGLVMLVMWGRLGHYVQFQIMERRHMQFLLTISEFILE